MKGKMVRAIFRYLDQLYIRVMVHLSVHGKPTHDTNWYLSLDSHHPSAYKVTFIRTLVGRADALCSSTSQMSAEV